MVYTMPRRKSKKDKRVVEQYEYVKVGKSKTKTKRTKKPKGSGDVVQTVIVQAPGRRRRAAKPKAEVWQPMAAPLVQQVVQPTQVPYQFRTEPAAPIMPVATPPKAEQPLITFDEPAAFQPVKNADLAELADVFRARSIPKTKDVGIEPEQTIMQSVETQTRKPKAKEMETQTDIPEAFILPELEPSMFDLTDIDNRLKERLGMTQEDMDAPQKVVEPSPKKMTIRVPREPVSMFLVPDEPIVERKPKVVRTEVPLVTGAAEREVGVEVQSKRKKPAKKITEQDIQRQMFIEDYVTQRSDLKTPKDELDKLKKEALRNWNKAQSDLKKAQRAQSPPDMPGTPPTEPMFV